jgi:hypothetical protein
MSGKANTETCVWRLNEKHATMTRVTTNANLIFMLQELQKEHVILLVCCRFFTPFAWQMPGPHRLLFRPRLRYSA